VKQFKTKFLKHSLVDKKEVIKVASNN